MPIQHRYIGVAKPGYLCLLPSSKRLELRLESRGCFHIPRPILRLLHAIDEARLLTILSAHLADSLDRY